MTTTGAAPDKPCIFPFIHEGVEYNECMKTLTFVANNNIASVNYKWSGISTNSVSSFPKTRCIRRGAVTVSSSGGGSSSGGSSTPSTLGNGMPTMISNESDSIMSYISASIYCSNLVESGYDDWILPNYEQISYAIGGGCIFNDNRTGHSLWTRTPNTGSSGQENVLTVRASYYTSNGGDQYYFLDNMQTDDDSLVSFCRCVR